MSIYAKAGVKATMGCTLVSGHLSHRALKLAAALSFWAQPRTQSGRSKLYWTQSFTRDDKTKAQLSQSAGFANRYQGPADKKVTLHAKHICHCLVTSVCLAIEICNVQGQGAPRNPRGRKQKAFER